MSNCPTCKNPRGMPAVLFQTTEEDKHHCMVCGNDYDSKGNKIKKER